MQTLLPDDELVALNLAFEDAHPREILTWALGNGGVPADRDRVGVPGRGHGIMIHMASTIRADVPMLFLETGFQFAETLAFKEQLTERLGLNVVDLYGEYTVAQQAERTGRAALRARPRAVLRPQQGAPMFEALRGLDAWVTAFRRDSSPTRAERAVRGAVRARAGSLDREGEPDGGLDPRQAWAYLREHDLPHNPLYDLGYTSIGCAPCTRLRFAGEPERAGRWAGRRSGSAASTSAKRRSNVGSPSTTPEATGRVLRVEFR